MELPVTIHGVREVSVLVAYVRYHFDLKLSEVKLDRNHNFAYFPFEKIVLYVKNV